MKKFEGFCPIRNILDKLGDKWTILVLLNLNTNGTMRFSELARNIPDISQRMLTITLRTLVQDGLISRKVYPEIPPKVEYTITDIGKTLMPHINGLVEWALANKQLYNNINE